MKLTRSGQKLDVIFPGQYTKPAAGYPSFFTNEVGVLSRSIIPTSTPNWAHVTNEDKQYLYQRLQDHFKIDIINDPHIKFSVDHMVQSQLGGYRSTLHQHYKKKLQEHGGAVYEHPPEAVPLEEWHVLCDRFSSDKFQRRSRINSENRSKLEVNHLSGSRSFVRNLYEMRNPETGDEGSAVDHYKDVHYRQEKGEWIHPTAEARWEEMNDKRNQLTSNGTKPNEISVVTEVLQKKSGYARGFGHGGILMVPTSTSSRSTLEESIRKSAEKSDKEIQVRMEGIRNEVRDEVTAELQLKMEEELARRTEELKLNQTRMMQEMFQKYIAQLQIPGFRPPPPL